MICKVCGFDKLEQYRTNRGEKKNKPYEDERIVRCRNCGVMYVTVTRIEGVVKRNHDTNEFEYDRDNRRPE